MLADIYQSILPCQKKEEQGLHINANAFVSHSMHQCYLLPTLILDSELRYQSGGAYTLGLSIAGLLNIFFSKLVWVILQWFNNILQSPAQQESVCWPHVYNSLRGKESF